mmetsp:Transcript_29154/g.74384  ORF Transcript_29154/g.74384 Transcript_29154/m.74384 type:complete len:216 (+) Transcript_29154:545-1192(+)
MPHAQGAWTSGSHHFQPQGAFAVPRAHHQGARSPGSHQASQGAQAAGAAHQAAGSGSHNSSSQLAMRHVAGAHGEVQRTVDPCSACQHPLHRHAAQGCDHAQVCYPLHHCNSHCGTGHGSQARAQETCHGTPHEAHDSTQRGHVTPGAESGRAGAAARQQLQLWVHAQAPAAPGEEPPGRVQHHGGQLQLARRCRCAGRAAARAGACAVKMLPRG